MSAWMAHAPLWPVEGSHGASRSNSRGFGDAGSPFDFFVRIASLAAIQGQDGLKSNTRQNGSIGQRTLQTPASQTACCFKIPHELDEKKHETEYTSLFGLHTLAIRGPGQDDSKPLFLTTVWDKYKFLDFKIEHVVQDPRSMVVGKRFRAIFDPCLLPEFYCIYRRRNATARCLKAVCRS